jgi:thymidylate synthase
MSPYFSIIYAVESDSRLFSKNGTIPWNSPEDMNYFKTITERPYSSSKHKNVLIMGRKTYNSKPSLNNFKRIEIVISKTLEGDNVCRSFDEALILASVLSPGGKYFLIGGSKLISEAFNHENCEEIFETLIPTNQTNTLSEKDEALYMENVPNKFFFVKCDVKNNINFRVYNRYKTTETNYLRLIKTLLDTGEQRNDRTGTGTLSLFGPQIEIDVSDSFPLLTTKKLNFNNILTEVLWFISGSTNTKFLTDRGVKIWEGNTSREFLNNRGFTDYKPGDTGPLYGYQWRHFGGDFKSDFGGGIDQLERMVKILREDPTSRRIFMSAWNPNDLDKMVLEPCHVSFQLYVSEGKYLDGKLYQRSCDVFLGCPWNITCYSLLLYMFAHICGYTPRKLIMSFGDVHIYSNHIEQVKEQLTRPTRPFPTLKIIKECKSFDEFDNDSFVIDNYIPHPYIKAEMAV